MIGELDYLFNHQPYWTWHETLVPKSGQNVSDSAKTRGEKIAALKVAIANIIDAAIAETREADARIAEQVHSPYNDSYVNRHVVAKAIRAAK